MYTDEKDGSLVIMHDIPAPKGSLTPEELKSLTPDLSYKLSEGVNGKEHLYTISGHRQPPENMSDPVSHHVMSRRWCDKYETQFSVPLGYNIRKATAKYSHGVFEVRFPKDEAPPVPPIET